jgi:hypothetical protein
MRLFLPPSIFFLEDNDIQRAVISLHSTRNQTRSQLKLSKELRGAVRGSFDATLDVGHVTTPNFLSRDLSPTIITHVSNLSGTSLPGFFCLYLNQWRVMHPPLRMSNGDSSAYSGRCRVDGEPGDGEHVEARVLIEPHAA